MKFKRYTLTYILSLCLIVVGLISCSKSIQSENLIARYDFESGVLDNSEGITISDFHGSKVSGNYNNGSFSTRTDNLPKHHLLKIKFELYIHDNWDGNHTGIDSIKEGPDLWRMDADGERVIETTFSTTACSAGMYCLKQSFPKNYPFQNIPNTGAADTMLPAFCASGTNTSLYHIEKVIKHTGNSVTLKFSDLLQQSNVINSICDESWSLDNLEIYTLQTD